MACVVILGTLDSKGKEFLYLKKKLEAEGMKTITVDAGIKGDPFFRPDISASQVAAAAQCFLQELRDKNDRGYAIEKMMAGAREVVCDLYRKGKVSGIISMGGSGGTTLASEAMRALPFGIPKILISTLASGNTKPYVDTSDIIMYPSLVDISGLNTILRRVLNNAARAMAAMASYSAACIDIVNKGKSANTIGGTMLGVTTPCVEKVKEELENEWEFMPFHANGTGGRIMEKLIEEGLIGGVLDITINELGNELLKGHFSAGKERMEVAGRNGLPQVVSLGGADIIVYQTGSVPEEYKSRVFYRHNPSITLMRTNPAENKKIAEVLANKLNRATGPVVLVVPRGGFSLIDMPGQPFYDPDADEALMGTLLNHLDSRIKVVIKDEDINHKDVSLEIVRQFRKIAYKNS